jgi:hypothetical protein
MGEDEMPEKQIFLAETLTAGSLSHFASQLPQSQPELPTMCVRSHTQARNKKSCIKMWYILGVSRFNSRDPHGQNKKNIVIHITRTIHASIEPALPTYTHKKKSSRPHATRKDITHHLGQHRRIYMPWLTLRVSSHIRKLDKWESEKKSPRGWLQIGHFLWSLVAILLVQTTKRPKKDALDNHSREGSQKNASNIQIVKYTIKEKKNSISIRSNNMKGCNQPDHFQKP